LKNRTSLSPPAVNIIIDFRIKTGKRIDIMLVSDFCRASIIFIVAPGHTAVRGNGPMLEMNGLDVC
jgi:hypothetical protein